VTGGLGNDVALLGAGDDLVRWKAGDGSDVIEGQDGFDTLDVTGAAAAETIVLLANGPRVEMTRDLDNAALDINGVERIQIHALGGADQIAVTDLSGTGVQQVAIDLAGVPNGTAGDGQVDTVTVNGTAGADNIKLSLLGNEIIVGGLGTLVTIDHADAKDVLLINGNDQNDIIDASGIAAGHINLLLNGRAGDDILLGG